MTWDHYSVTLTCSAKDCGHYLHPVEVGAVREHETGASSLVRDEDWYCECGAERVDHESLFKFDLHVVEWVAPRVRRRYAQLVAA